MDENYIPYADEWEKEVMKFTKRALVKLWRSALLDYPRLARDEALDKSKKIKAGIFKIKKEIEHEISTRPEYSNIGKRGCVARLDKLIKDNFT